MPTNCLNCGTGFKARRTTKKYCSHNCKQMAYFKRNGMTFGINGSPTENLKLFTVKDDNSDNVKYDTVIEKQEEQVVALIDTVKLEPEITTNTEVIVNQNDSVKDVKENALNLEKEGFLLNEALMKQLITGVSSILESKIQQGINKVKEELNLKCSSVKAENDLTQNTVNESTPESSNENSQENTILSKVIKTEGSLPEQKYEWIGSKFYENIEAYNEITSDSFDFRNNQDMEWVNLRLRCVIENVIRLNEFAFIDRYSLLKLNETLNKILESQSYQNIHDHYPFTETIVELSQWLDSLSGTKNQNVPLRISFSLKAKLVSVQNQLKENVPLMPFNEINFTEPHRGIFLNQTQTSQKNKKSNNWRERHKQYVEAGLIEPDEDDTD